MSGQSIKKWENKPSTGGHFGALDGIRGIAILMVVVFHTFYTNPQAGPVSRIIGLFFVTGSMGVSIFFVLSGFLIAYPFFRQKETDSQSWHVKGYARRRIGKIVPPFYLSILIFAGYYFIRSSNPAYLLAGVQWALGLANFFQPAVPVNASYWSLIVEAHFYALLPVLFYLFKGRNSRSTTVFLFIIMFFVPFIARYLTWPSEAASRDHVGFLMSRFPCSLDFFSWGVLFAGFFASHRETAAEAVRLRFLGYAGILFILVTIGLYMFLINQFDILSHPRRWSIEVVRLLPSFSTFLMLFFLFDRSCIGSRLLSLAPLRFTGLISYEWFLFHQPVVAFFQELIPNSRGSISLYLIKTVLPLVLTFGFSVLVYRYFSFPLMQWFRGERTGQPARQPKVAANTVPAGGPLVASNIKSTDQN